LIARQTLASSTDQKRLHKRLNIHYQSRGIPFSEWLAQFTLCFAPFASHVLIGVPTFIVVSRKRPPPWTQINFFNPITILWRYAMIADRRLRSSSWTAEDMAASNVAFWTGYKWDGSEKIMVDSRAWVTQSPDRNRVSFMSISMLGTIIVTVQGVQALYQLTQIIWTKVSPIQALGDMFIPIALGSLFRLPAALWLLTDDFGYDAWRLPRPFGSTVRPSSSGSHPTSPFSKDNFALKPAPAYKTLDMEALGRGNSFHISEASWPLPTRTSNSGKNLLLYGSEVFSKDDNLRPQTYWKAVILRLIFLFALLGIVVVFGVGHLLAEKNAPTIASLIFVHFLYTSLCFVLLILGLYYSTTGKANSVLIPCINSKWYTMFTIAWYGFVVVCIVVNCIEMRRTVCGVYTTVPPSAGLDDRLCSLYEI
jgi:hypothetical protein